MGHKNRSKMIAYLTWKWQSIIFTFNKTNLKLCHIFSWNDSQIVRKINSTDLIDVQKSFARSNSKKKTISTSKTMHRQLFRTLFELNNQSINTQGTVCGFEVYRPGLSQANHSKRIDFRRVFIVASPQTTPQLRPLWRWCWTQHSGSQRRRSRTVLRAHINRAPDPIAIKTH